MTTAELIKVLKTFPKDLPVVYRCCSEQALLEAKDTEVESLCAARDDGWPGVSQTR